MRNSGRFYEHTAELPPKLNWSEPKPVRERGLGELNCPVESVRPAEVFSERIGRRIMHTALSGREKRSEPRFATNDTAVFQILNPFSEESWHIRVLDVSKNGLRICIAMAPLRGFGCQSEDERLHSLR
jgi:hypothetical protein